MTLLQYAHWIESTWTSFPQNRQCLSFADFVSSLATSCHDFVDAGAILGASSPRSARVGFLSLIFTNFQQIECIKTLGFISPNDHLTKLVPPPHTLCPIGFTSNQVARRVLEDTPSIESVREVQHDSGVRD
jgi:hypothetical protein